jgi:hypothetical protein
MIPQRIWSRTKGRVLWGADDPGRRPVIIANPPGDREFRRMIDSALVSGEWRPQDLEKLLRTRYPSAVVRPRELDAERIAVWYAYRDGHWIRSEQDAES